MPGEAINSIETAGQQIQLQRGVTLHAAIVDMQNKYIASTGREPRYLLISPDYANELIEGVYRTTLPQMAGSNIDNEEYMGMVIIIASKKDKFVDIVG